LRSFSHLNAFALVVHAFLRRFVSFRSFRFFRFRFAFVRSHSVCLRYVHVIYVSFCSTFVVSFVSFVPTVFCIRYGVAICCSTFTTFRCSHISVCSSTFFFSPIYLFWCLVVLRHFYGADFRFNFSHIHVVLHLIVLILVIRSLICSFHTFVSTPACILIHSFVRLFLTFSFLYKTGFHSWVFCTLFLVHSLGSHLLHSGSLFAFSFLRCSHSHHKGFLYIGFLWFWDIFLSLFALLLFSTSSTLISLHVSLTWFSPALFSLFSFGFTSFSFVFSFCGSSFSSFCVQFSHHSSLLFTHFFSSFGSFLVLFLRFARFAHSLGSRVALFAATCASHKMVLFGSLHLVLPRRALHCLLAVLACYQPQDLCAYRLLRFIITQLHRKQVRLFASGSPPRLLFLRLSFCVRDLNISSCPITLVLSFLWDHRILSALCTPPPGLRHLASRIFRSFPAFFFVWFSLYLFSLHLSFSLFSGFTSF